MVLSLGDEPDEKLIARIKARPVEASFADVQKVLELHGWRLARRRGSHVTFNKRGEPAIVVPLVRGSRVNGVYLDHIIAKAGTVMARRKPLDFYLRLEYPFHVIADPEGGYVINFPDLPGCFTQADSIDEVAAMADEARQLWIETEYDDGHSIPMPSYPEEYSGKFNLRLPKSLHRQLAERAETEGVSLNQYVLALLAASVGERRVLSEIEPTQTRRKRAG